MQPPAAGAVPPVRDGGSAEVKAGLPLTSTADPDITKELDALLAEKADGETSKGSPLLKSVPNIESSNFRADAPAFVPAFLKEKSKQSGLNAEAPVFVRGATTPTLGSVPDPNNSRLIEELDAQLSGNPVQDGRMRRAPGIPTPASPALKARFARHGPRYRRDLSDEIRKCHGRGCLLKIASP